MIEYDYPIQISPGVYRWFIQLIMPIGFLLIAFQIFLKSSKEKLFRILMLLIGILLLLLVTMMYFVVVFIFYGFLLVLFCFPCFMGHPFLLV